MTDSHGQFLRHPAAETALARRRHLAPVVHIVLLEESRDAVVRLTADTDHLLDRLRGILLEQDEMPELRLERPARQGQPEPEHSIWKDAVIPQLDMARAEGTQPALYLGEGGLVVLLEEGEGVLRHPVHVAGSIVRRLPKRDRVPVDEDVTVGAIELVLVRKTRATEVASMNLGASD